jgi:cyclophilin family peptidyl-prolyl cis-trans isomerase
MRTAVFICVVLIIASCSPKHHVRVNRFADPINRTIADLQDRRNTDTLMTFLAGGNVAHRASAARAFGSVQDSTSLGSLAKLMNDDTSKLIRHAVAFSLGQTPSLKSTQLIKTDQLSDPELLEALGKVARSFDDINICIPRNPNDFTAGHGWMLYRFGLNHPFDSVPSGVPSNALDPRQPLQQRLSVTQFLARGVKKNKSFKASLIECVLQDSSADVRMNAAFALRRTKDDEVMQVLQRVATNDVDHRVRVNAIRSLQAFPLEKIKSTLFHSLNDSMVNVAVAASDVIENMSHKSILSEIMEGMRTVSNFRVKANLYAAFAKVSPSTQIAEEIIRVSESCPSPYGKAFMVKALQYDSSGRQALNERMMTASSPVIKSTAAASLAYLFRTSGRHTPLRKDIARSFADAIHQGDVAVISILSEAIADTSLHFRDFYNTADFLKEARSRLSLPRDIETIQPLENAIAIIENKPVSEPPTNPFNHPINWPLVQSIPVEQKMLIETSRGKIIIRLFVEEAPGAVANFVGLAERGYFNNKFFHRVVPNFVVQAGCHRGDGWGSEDYSIRSEFTPRKFTTGSVGMASAGKDTEGTQWFITHSPTPHLDGRYTNFAEVVSGMEVVHRLEVGDQIISVKRL